MKVSVSVKVSVSRVMSSCFITNAKDVTIHKSELKRGPLPDSSVHSVNHSEQLVQ